MLGVEKKTDCKVHCLPLSTPGTAEGGISEEALFQVDSNVQSKVVRGSDSRLDRIASELVNSCSCACAMLTSGAASPMCIL